MSVKTAYFRPRLSILRKSAVLGLPSFVQTSGMSLLAIIINNSLGAYGGDAAITTYGMCHKILSIVILPVIGIVQGFQPIAGYNYGARDFGRVKKSLRIAITTAFCVSLAGYALMELAPRFVMRLFTRDAGLIESSARVLRTIVLFVPLAAVQITGSTYFQAIGKPREAFLLGLSRQFIVLIPLVLVLPRFLGLGGLWFAFPLADILSTSITTTLLFRELSRLHKLVAKAV